MDITRQNDLDIFTRIIHLGLIIFGLLSFGTGDWADDYEEMQNIGFFVHGWLGIGVSLFLGSRLTYGIVGPENVRFSYWVPYKKERLQLVLEDIAGLIRLRLPDRQPHQGLASVVEVLGLFVFLLLAVTGGLLFLFLEPGHKATGSIHVIEEIHEIGEVLVPIFLAVHGGAVLLHALTGRHLWRKMIFLK